MSPVSHPVSGPMLSFSLWEELKLVRSHLDGATTRSARTLVKEGALRVTLVGLAPGGTISEHKADGPVTIHVLEGEITVASGGESLVLGDGMLAALEAGVSHGVHAPKGGAFLLTVIAGTRDSGDSTSAGVQSNSFSE